MRDDVTPLTPDLLLTAYATGIFPMAERRGDPEIFWVDPRMRGIIPLGGFHISRSLARRMRRGAFSVTTDRAFAAVVQGCAEREETWINDTIFDLYEALHSSGHAHSLEVWSPGGDLIGGVYGVALGAAFFGESMFSRTTDASKIALVWLVARLNAGGFTLLDTQFVTEHLRRLGATEVSRARYHQLLEQALARPADFYSLADDASPETVLQLSTQRS